MFGFRAIIWLLLRSGGTPPAGDTTPPVLSSPTGTQTGASTATWGVTSNEAGGTIYAAARLASNPVLSKADIESGTGNAVEINNDTSPTADANNGGSFHALTQLTSYDVDIFQRDAAGNESAVVTSAQFTTDGPDVVAPILSSPTAAKTGTTTATWGVTSDEAEGTVFAAARVSTDPVLSTSDIENGTGDAVATDSDTTATADANNGGSFTGLTDGTTYVVDIFQRDGAGNESSVVTSASFATDAADTTAPVLSSPTASATSTTTADWGVTSDEAGGTVYAALRLATSGALLKLGIKNAPVGNALAGDTDASPTADANNGGSFTGLTAGTDYICDIYQEDASGNESAIISSAQFTTTVAGPTASSVSVANQQSSGDLAVTVTNLSEDSPDSYFVASTSATKPTPAQVRAGQDHTGSAAAAAGTFSVTAASPTANPVLPSGLDGSYYLHFDFGNASAEYSEVYTDSTAPVDIDTTAASLSVATGTETGSTTADWGVTSDEAGGTIYAAARVSTDAVLSKDNIKNGTGNAVATSSDASPTADANNAGSFTGLSASTTYIVDIYQEDAYGNESSVASSSSFTTDAGGASSSFIESLSAGSVTTSHSLVLTSALSSGDYLIGVANLNGTSQISSVTLEGTTATQRGSGFNANSKSLEFHEVNISGGGNKTVGVSVTSGTDRVAVTVWKLGSKTYQGEDSDGPPHAAGPHSADIQFNTSAGDEVFVISGSNTAPDTTMTNLTQRADDVVINGRHFNSGDNLSATGGTPETFSVDYDLGWDNEDALGVHYA